MTRDNIIQAGVFVGLIAVVYLFLRRGGTPMQQQSGNVPTKGADVPYGPFYLNYNMPKAHLPTVSGPSRRAMANNAGVPACTACDDTVMFGTDSDFAKYLSTQLTGVWEAYRDNIMGIMPEWLLQYYVR